MCFGNTTETALLSVGRSVLLRKSRTPPAVARRLLVTGFRGARSRGHERLRNGRVATEIGRGEDD